MRTTEEITKKIQEIMEGELKAFYECNKAREYWENKNCHENEEKQKANIDQTGSEDDR